MNLGDPTGTQHCSTPERARPLAGRLRDDSARSVPGTKRGDLVGRHGVAQEETLGQP